MFEALARDLSWTPTSQDFVLPEYQHYATAWLTDAYQGKDTYNAELALRTKSGSRVDLLLSISTSSSDGAVGTGGAVAVGHDITLRKQAEGRAEHELQAFISEANAPIFGIDTAYNVNVWNDKIATITGYPADEVVGKTRQVRTSSAAQNNVARSSTRERRNV